MRLAVQAAFIIVNLWVGIRFFLWVEERDVAKPVGIEGWLPIAGLMNLKVWVVTHAVPHSRAAAMFFLVAFLAVSLLLKKSFCSWLCPIGTLSEWLWKLGRKAGGNFTLPRGLDVPLRGVKYALLAFFVWAIVKMPVGAIVEFMDSPYGRTADVRMLSFFRHLSTTAAVVLAVLIALSVAVKNFWCRYLCPYGALLGIVSIVSPVVIRRNAALCIDCAKCAKACPSRLPVDTKPRIRSAECSLCMSCVAACPVKDALQVRVTTPRSPSAFATADARGTLAATRPS